MQAWQAAGRMTARRLYHVRVQRLCWPLALPWRAVTRTRPMSCRLPLCACVAAGLVRARRRLRAGQPHRQCAVHAVRAALQVLGRCHLYCTWGASRSVRRQVRRVGAQLPLRPGLRRHRAQRLHQRGRAVLAQSPAVRRAALLAARESRHRAQANSRLLYAYLGPDCA
jgi:hypothetical protein